MVRHIKDVFDAWIAFKVCKSYVKVEVQGVGRNKWKIVGKKVKIGETHHIGALQVYCLCNMAMLLTWPFV